MKKFFIPFALILFISLITVGEMRSLKTGVTSIDMILDGNRIKGGWGVVPEVNPDVLETTSNEIKFVSDVDSIVIDNLKEWESYNFVILTNTGDSAFVRVDKIAANPFENPNPKLLEIANSGKLLRMPSSASLLTTLASVAIAAWSVPGTHRAFLPMSRARRTRMSWIVLLSMWPMWSIPVTFGGGITIVNGSRASGSE